MVELWAYMRRIFTALSLYFLTLYLMICGFSAIVNLLVFCELVHIDIPVAKAAPAAFILAAMLNYALCILSFNFLRPRFLVFPEHSSGA
jgi:hypothetical protein